jgi:hypothetical protein
LVLLIPLLTLLSSIFKFKFILSKLPDICGGNKEVWGSGAAESFLASLFLSEETLSEPLLLLKLFFKFGDWIL